MFKRFLVFVLIISALPIAVNAETLNQFYNGHIPTFSWRKIFAQEVGIKNYRGTAQQNTQLLSFLFATPRGGHTTFGATPSEPTSTNQGYNPVTGYQSILTSYISSVATVIPVVSTKDLAGNPIVLANISPSSTVKVYMTAEPGNPTNQEEIMCTGVTVSSWTNCVRGLPFQTGSEISSSTLAKTHNAGSTIIITNSSQFYNQFISVDGSQNINGVKTFTQFPIAALNLTNSITNTQQFATVGFAQAQGSSGFTCANASTTLGIQCNGVSPSQVGVNPSSTTGLGFDGAGKLYQKVDTSTGLTQTSAGIGLSTTTLVGLIATTTPTVGIIPLFKSNLQLTVSSTPLSSTDAVSKLYADTKISGVSTTQPFKVLTSGVDYFATSTPGLIFATATGNTGGQAHITISIGTSTANYIIIADTSVGLVSGQTQQATATGIVPANWFYKVVLGGSGASLANPYFIPFSF